MKSLPIGKLDSDILQSIVIDAISYKRPEVLTRAGVGEDCAVIDFGEYECVVSTDPITADAADIGRLAIHISCNDVASNGIEPLGITLACLLPEGTTVEDIETIMSQAGRAAEQCGVEIIGGHTEITRAVNKPVIVSTAFGRGVRGASQSAADMSPGDWILMTKSAGLEGTGIIASDLRQELEGVLSRAELEEASALLDQVSVVKEGIIAGKIGTTGMHDVTEGGIFGAVWEMCRISGLGAELQAADIPVAEVTKKIAAHYGIDYYRLISSGCMLITAKESQAKEIMKQVSDAGIPVTKIGVVTGENQGVFGVFPEGRREIAPPAADELYKAVRD